MNCFIHQEASAVGICKSCGRGVCRSCAREVEAGIVCSEACEREHALLREMNVRALKIYGIGVARKGLPNTVIAPLLMGGAFTIAALVMNIMAPNPAPLVVLFLPMAAVGFLGAFIAHRKFRDNGVNV